MPNLARKVVGMVGRRQDPDRCKLIEGAKWSDGDPFDIEDIEFYWNDVIMDEK